MGIQTRNKWASLERDATDRSKMDIIKKTSYADSAFSAIKKGFDRSFDEAPYMSKVKKGTLTPLVKVNTFSGAFDINNVDKTNDWYTPNSNNSFEVLYNPSSLPRSRGVVYATSATPGQEFQSMEYVRGENMEIPLNLVIDKSDANVPYGVAGAAIGVIPDIAELSQFSDITSALGGESTPSIKPELDYIESMLKQTKEAYYKNYDDSDSYERSDPFVKVTVLLSGIMLRQSPTLESSDRSAGPPLFFLNMGKTYSGIVALNNYSMETTMFGYDLNPIRANVSLNFVESPLNYDGNKAPESFRTNLKSELIYNDTPSGVLS